MAGGQVEHFSETRNSRGKDKRMSEFYRVALSFPGWSSIGSLARVQNRDFIVIDSPLFYHSDAAPFANAGVLAIFVASGITDLKGTTTIRKKMAEAAKCIHQPCDVPHEDWDLTGTAEDTQVWFSPGLCGGASCGTAHLER